MIGTLGVAGWAAGAISGAPVCRLMRASKLVKGSAVTTPGLMASTGMTLANAGASSLVSVTLFGTATSLSYAAAGQLVWPLVGALTVGGAIGTVAALPLARRLQARADLARRIFAVLVIAVALYMLAR